MKYLVRHKRSVAMVAIGAVALAGMTAAVWRRGATLSLLPSSARNMVSALSVAATEIVGESFGIGVAGDGVLSGGETVVLDDGGSGEAGGYEEADPSSSYTVPLSPEYSPLRTESSTVGEDKEVPPVSPPAMPPVSQQSLSAADALLPILESFSSTSDSSSFEKISCAFPPVSPATSSLSGKIIFNEIAWMGSPSSSLPAGASEGNAEWMELKNDSSGTIALAGWRIENASGKIAIRFGENDRMEAGALLLLMRGSTTFPYAHASEVSYTGNLKNDGDDLAVLDPSCGVSDYVAFAGKWPAGDNATKRTMERDAAGGWHTSAVSGGTPGAENSIYAPPARYEATIVFSGAGGASVTSDPAGIACGAARCEGLFDEGTKVKLTAAPAAGMVFGGWSGACSGKGTCAFTIKGRTDITAMFSVPDALPQEEKHAEEAPPEPPPPVSSSTERAGDVLIVAVQIAGAAASNDYVRLYNPTMAPIAMDGWKLKKRSATGAEYSLRTFPSGMAIGAGGYLVWANAKDGFAASLAADVSSTETLAADNSIALIDVGGNVDDALAWGKGSGQFVEGEAFPDDPTEGQMLVRKMVESVPVDTGNNAEDFLLQ